MTSPTETIKKPDKEIPVTIEGIPIEKWNERMKELYFECSNITRDAIRDIMILTRQQAKEEFLKMIDEYNEKKYGHTKDSCESQEYDAIKELKAKLEKKE